MYKALNKILKQAKNQKGFNFSSLFVKAVPKNNFLKISQAGFAEKAEPKFTKISDETKMGGQVKLFFNFSITKPESSICAKL